MRPAFATPGLLLIIVAAFCAAMSFCVISAGTMSVPWFGIKLAAAPDGQGVVIAGYSDLAYFPEPQPRIGARVEAITIPGGAPVPIEALDILPEPDSLSSYAEINAFFARQSLLNALLANPQEKIEIHAIDPLDGTRSVTSAFVEFRPFFALPDGFWVQLLTGIGAVMIAGWVWALRPRKLAPMLFLVSALGMMMSTATSAIYANRALAIDGNLFSILQPINSIGAVTFGVAMIGLLLIYPVQLVRFAWLWLLLPVQAGMMFLIVTQTGIGPSQLYIYIAAATLVILGAIAAQWWQTRHDPAERAALGWLGLSIAVGCLAYTVFGALPILLDLPIGIPQTHVTGVLIVIYAGLALGIARYRLFELGDWAYRILFYTSGAILMLLIDMALIVVLNFDAAPALGLSLALVAFVYLPLRDWVWRRLTARRRLPQHELFSAALDVAFAPSPEESDQRWRALLARLFDPLEIEATAPVTTPVAQDDGLILDLPAVGNSPPLRLTFPHSGRGLFSPADVKLATNLVTLTERAEESRQAYMRGVGEERRRMARDLHDDVGARLLTGLHTADERTRPTLQAALSDIRAIVSGLAGEEAELERVLAEIRHEAARRLEAAGIALDWPLPETEAPPFRLDYRIHKALTSAVREIVSNVIRHSGATELVVTPEQHANHLTLRFADNGAGLPPAALKGETTGYGLRSLRQRIEDLGGSVSIGNGVGTTVVLSLTLTLAANAPEPGVQATMAALDSPP